MRADRAHDDDAVSFAFKGNAELFFAEASVKLPRIVENVNSMVDGFGDHIVHLRLISYGAEMEAAHAQDGTFKAGATQRTLLHLETARRDFVATFDFDGDRSWKHDRNSGYCGTFQETSPAYLRSDFGVVVIHTVHP
jgi:hypothetical protein